MRILLINGPIGVGKTKIGKELALHVHTAGENTVFFDMDHEFELVNHFAVTSEEIRKERWLAARKNTAQKVNASHANAAYIIISGPFYQKDEIESLTNHIDKAHEVFLYNLTAPLDVRLKQNKKRGEQGEQAKNDDQTLIDLDKQIQELQERFGVDINNDREIKETIAEILTLIETNTGKLL